VILLDTPPLAVVGAGCGIVLPASVEAFFEEALGKAGIQLLPLTPRVAAQAAALPDLHRDPMDRVIIATAIEHGAELVSKDDVIAKYPGIVVLWND
jgi:PIN domain nuclease of toxin-antitoxin system